MKDSERKILPLSELEEIVGKIKKAGKKIVTTNGAFDILHVGHLTLLEKSKELGDVLVVGINSDSSIKKYKSENRPVIVEKDRARLVAALSCVDYVVIFDEPDPVNFLELVKPNIHTKGGDYNAEELIETPVVRKNGGEVVIIPGRIQSTTEIIEHVLRICG